MTPAESKKHKTSQILSFLRHAYPDARCHLNFSNPLQLLIGSILSAQCTDDRVNRVTHELFKKYRSAGDFAKAELDELENDIRSTGFFRNKARSIKRCCQSILDNFGGQVPDNIGDLVKLPGVGRKTANVIIGNYFKKPGIIVDTHIKRLSNRLGLTTETDPVKIEYDLMDILPEQKWTFFSNALGDHGRNICKSRKPLCSRCDISGICPSFETLSKL